LEQEIMSVAQITDWRIYEERSVFNRHPGI
jgi:hypothetical protein